MSNEGVNDTRALHGARRSGTSASALARAGAGAIALPFAVSAWAYYTRQPWALSTWPWPDAPMTYVFLAAVAAAVAVILATVAALGELAPLRGVAIDLAVTAGTACAYLAIVVAGGDRASVPALAVAAAALVAGVAIHRLMRGFAVHDVRPTPAYVRTAFVGFAAILATVGACLVLQQQVFPWRLQPHSASVVGCTFLGAAAYFAHAAVQRHAPFAIVPLAGFLAYDVVLFAPYLRMFANNAGAADDYGYGYDTPGTVNLHSLVVYLAVLGTSALLAVVTIAISPRTRVFGRRSRAV